MSQFQNNKPSLSQTNPFLVDSDLNLEQKLKKLAVKEKKNKPDFKSVFCQMANLDMTMRNLTEKTRYTDGHMAHDGVWIYSVTINEGGFKNFTMSCTGETKKEAEMSAYKELVLKIKSHLEKSIACQNPHTAKLLKLCGDVEENPGPFSLENRQFNIIEGEEKAMIILPNQYTFHIANDNYIRTADGIIIQALEKRVLDEVIGQINIDNVMPVEDFKGQQPRTRKYNTQETRSTIYSDHEDFQPRQRLKIFISRALERVTNTNDLRMALEEGEGQIAIRDNVIFLPKNTLMFRWSKRLYYGHKTTPEIFSSALSSVSNQKMTKRQLVEMAIQLSTLQMSYTQCKHSPEAYLALFGLFFKQNIVILIQGRAINCSFSDAWQEMKQCDVYIPTREFSEVKKVLKPDQTALNYRRFPDDQEMDAMIATELNPDYKNMSVSEGIERFLEGSLFAYGEEPIPLRFKNTGATRFISDSIPEMNEFQKAIVYLIEDRFQETNLLASFKRTLVYAKRWCTEATQKKLLYKMIRFRIDSNYQPGLARLHQKTRETNRKIDVPEMNRDMIAYFLEQPETNLARFAQQEFTTWAVIFGEPKVPNYFYSKKYILGLLSDRAMYRQTTKPEEPPPEQPIDEGASTSTSTTNSEDFKSILSEEESSDEEEENTEGDGFFVKTSKKIYKKVRAPFDAGKKLFDKVCNAADAVTNLEKLCADTKQEVADKFNKVNMPSVAQTVSELNFETFQSSFESVKGIIDAWFKDFATKICSIFGVEFESSIPATTLFFYYMIWIKNDNTVVRYMILVDVMVQLGLVDFFFRILKGLASGVRDLFKQNDTSEFDDLIDGITRNTEEITAKNNKFIRTHVEKIENKAKAEQDFDVEEKGFLDGLLNFFTTGGPVALGLLATVFITQLGLAPMKETHKDLGTRIANSMRSISFISLGLLALPKIFETIMGVIYWVQDHVKKLVLDNHQTHSDICEEIKQWLLKANYVDGVSQFIFVRSTEDCLRFLDSFTQMLEIRQKLDKVKVHTLRVEFCDRAKLMQKLMPIVQSAMKILVGQQEIFHVQLWSTECGVGKTDASRLICESLDEVLRQKNDEIRTLLNMEVGSSRTGIYPMNDSLSPRDLLHG